MRKYLKIVDRHRGTKWVRFANFFIDRLIFNVSFLLLGFVGVFIDQIFGFSYFTDFFAKVGEIGRVADYIMTSILYFIYMFLIEYFTKGRSIGKYITGTKVIATDGEAPTLNEYFIRNISRIVPFDGLSFFGENGWHDSWSETRVINIKDYEAERQAKSEIDDLGKKEIA